MGRFETGWLVLTNEGDLKILADLSATWIDGVHENRRAAWPDICYNLR
jgi:hypothetical protein